MEVRSVSEPFIITHVNVDVMGCSVIVCCMLESRHSSFNVALKNVLLEH